MNSEGFLNGVKDPVERAISQVVQICFRRLHTIKQGPANPKRGVRMTDGAHDGWAYKETKESDVRRSSRRPVVLKCLHACNAVHTVNES